MSFARIKARVIDAITRKVREEAEEAEAIEAAAHRQLTDAHVKLLAAEIQARRLAEMDQRNHYSQSLTQSYRRTERPA